MHFGQILNKNKKGNETILATMDGTVDTAGGAPAPLAQAAAAAAGQAEGSVGLNKLGKQILLMKFKLKSNFKF